MQKSEPVGLVAGFFCGRGELFNISSEWDDDKNEVNKREHEGLGFELA
jgi:hypothetical protein